MDVLIISRASLIRKTCIATNQLEFNMKHLKLMYYDIK